VDSTPDGSNLFFTSDQQLVPQDADNGFDIYDARVGGGFAFSPPAPACQGDSCKPPETPAPAAPAAASISFSGPGNTAAPTVGKAHILSRSVSGTTIKLQVTVPAAGLLVVSGSYVTKVTRIVGAAGTYTITLHLTKAAKNRLKHMRRLKASKRKLSFTVTVRYASVTGSSSSGHVKLTVKA
jgi:hypothetical protein